MKIFNYLCGKNKGMLYYKRVIGEDIIQLHLHVFMDEYTKSEIFTINKEYSQDIYFPIEQMIEIKLFEFQAIACKYDLLKSSYQQQPKFA